MCAQVVEFQAHGFAILVEPYSRNYAQTASQAIRRIIQDRSSLHSRRDIRPMRATQNANYQAVQRGLHSYNGSNKGRNHEIAERILRTSRQCINIIIRRQ